MAIYPAVEVFKQALLDLDRVEVDRLLTATQSDPVHSIDELVVPALESLGSDWEVGNASLSQVYMSGRICEEAIDRLLPPDDARRKDQPRIAIAVLQDYHMLGKRIVYSVLRASGYALRDYGQGQVESIAERVVEDGVEVLMVSTLMLPSALRVAQLRTALDKRGMATKLVVGGAPFRFDEALWREVGADAMGKTAADALAILTSLQGGEL